MNLFPREKFEFSFADSPDLYDSVGSNKTPINFVYRKNALERITTFSNRHRKIQTDEQKIYFNPVDMFLKTKDEKEVNLYYNFDSERTISSLNKFVTDIITQNAKESTDSTDCYFVKYIDSQIPETKKITTIYWNEDNAFSPVCFTTNNKQYSFILEDEISGSEIFKVYGDLLYLATCGIEQDIVNTNYNEYLRTYDEIINNIIGKNYVSANQKFAHLKEIKAKNGENELNYAEKDLQSLISFFAQNEYDSTGYSHFDNLLKSAYIFQNNYKEQMTPEFQKMVCSNYKSLGLTKTDLNYMLEYFYNLKTTSENDRALYRKTLIEQGYYNDEIFNSLSGTEFCKYLYNIMNSYDNSISIQDNSISKTTLVGKEKEIRNDMYSQIKIQDFLKQHNLLSDKGVVVWCVEPDGVFFKDYPLMLFYKDKILYIPDYTETKPEFYSESYTHIDLHKGGFDIKEYGSQVPKELLNYDFNSYQITIGGKKHTNKVLFKTI